MNSGPTRTYRVGSSTLTVRFGSLLDSTADVIVSSDDYLLSMGGGVSQAIARAAGSAIVVDAAKAVPLELGDVAVTTAGALPARFVFHVATIGPQHSGSPDDDMLIRQATDRCLHLARELGATSIAFPALGAGVARIEIGDVAAGMAASIVEGLHDDASVLNVELHLVPKRWQSDMDYVSFFESLARHVALTEVAGVGTHESTARRQPAALDHQRQQILDVQADRVSLEHRLLAPTPQDSVESLAAEIQRTSAELEAALSERQPVRLFISYSHDDHDLALRLTQHLSSLSHQGLATWTDRRIPAGADWEDEISEAIETTDIALALISPSFIGSQYCISTEWQLLNERRKDGKVVLVPIIIRPCNWTYLVGDLQALPVGAHPVSRWEDIDEAFVSVLDSILELVNQLKVRRRQTAQDRDNTTPA